MKTMQVEVTDAQAEFINAMCRELGGVRPGDLLLAEAFTGVGCLDEDHLHHIIAGLNAFIVRRELPKFDVGELLPVCVHSRPAPGASASVAQAPGNAAPADEKVGITVRVSESLARIINGCAMILGQTPEEYAIESIMSSVEADCGLNRYYESTPEFKEVARSREENANLAADRSRNKSQVDDGETLTES